MKDENIKKIFNGKDVVSFLKNLNNVGKYNMGKILISIEESGFSLRE